MIEQVPDGDEVCSWLVADQRCLHYFPSAWPSRSR